MVLIQRFTVHDGFHRLAVVVLGGQIPVSRFGTVTVLAQIEIEPFLLVKVLRGAFAPVG